VYVSASARKVQMKVADQLSGTVVGDVPSPIDAKDGNSRVIPLIGQKVAVASSASQGEYVRMLKQVNNLLLPPSHGLNGPLLQYEGVGIIYLA